MADRPKTRFAKRKLPKFNVSVLDFPLFEKNWAIEFKSSGLPKLIELNHLKYSTPSSAKDRFMKLKL